MNIYIIMWESIYCQPYSSGIAKVFSTLKEAKKYIKQQNTDSTRYYIARRKINE